MHRVFILIQQVTLTYFVTAVLCRQNPQCTCSSSLPSYYRTQLRCTLLVLVCLWLYHRTCGPWLFLSFILLFSCWPNWSWISQFLAPPLEYRWVLQAALAAVLYTWDILLYFNCRSSFNGWRLLKIPVPSPTPMQLSPPAAGTQIRGCNWCRCSLSTVSRETAACEQAAGEPVALVLLHARVAASPVR